MLDKVRVYVQKANEMLDGVDALVNAAGTLIK